MLLVVWVLGGCGEPDPVRLPLSALRASQVEYDGRLVVVSGTVRSFEEPRHFWIENRSLDRVALEGAAGLEELVGQRVEVSGRFVYDPDAGRRIEVLTLKPLP